jgi:hypothetical protein
MSLYSLKIYNDMWVILPIPSPRTKDYTIQGVHKMHAIAITQSEVVRQA